jgi:hypothetical protein
VDHQLIAPALALIGTLLVALLGFYQWRKQNANPNRAANATARREAYEGLWKRLEEINLELRKTGDQAANLSDQLRSINEYFIGHSLYFDDADQLIVNKYVSALHVVRSAIEQSNDADLKAKYSETGIFNTAKILPVVTATEEMEKYRAIIKEKAKKVAGSV